jgi:hypothetical protein
MRIAALEDEHSLAAASPEEIAVTHPAWRKFVAAAMAAVFVLTLAAAGFLLCAA